MVDAWDTPHLPVSRAIPWKKHTWQFFVTFLGWLSDLLERLSDLQIGDKKVTLNHLAGVFSLKRGRHLKGENGEVVS